MPTLIWSDALALSHPEMDLTHQEFVALLAATEAAVQQSPPAGLEAYKALVEHTVAHFGQEDRWMLATGFAPENCHSFQHAQVLALMQEVTALAEQQQDYGPLQRVLPELGIWFVSHAQSMDAALAEHLKQRGFDPATGHQRAPLAADTPAVTGCGGGACSPAEQGAMA